MSNNQIHWTDTPYDTADKWLLKENLPLAYRQQIVEFILQNSGQQQEFTFDPSFSDPFTGCEYCVIWSIAWTTWRYFSFCLWLVNVVVFFIFQPALMFLETTPTSPVLLGLFSLADLLNLSCMNCKHVITLSNSFTSSSQCFCTNFQAYSQGMFNAFSVLILY